MSLHRRGTGAIRRLCCRLRSCDLLKLRFRKDSLVEQYPSHHFFGLLRSGSLIDLLHIVRRENPFAQKDLCQWAARLRRALLRLSGQNRCKGQNDQKRKMPDKRQKNTVRLTHSISFLQKSEGGWWECYSLPFSNRSINPDSQPAVPAKADRLFPRSLARNVLGR